MDMIDIPVTLIVKAPNQQIEDQTIHCELNWTIRKLKGYLSEVYPSKPRTEDQKLIYSGQLLHDSVTLKDILRRYEGQETHTVHLVCTPSRDSLRHASTVVTKVPSRMSESGQISTNPAVENVRNQETEVPSDGLRQRLTASQPSEAQQSSSQPYSSTANGQFPPIDPRTFWAGAMTDPYATTPGYDPNSMSQQLLWMQQAYAQYVTQYMQLMTSGGLTQSWYPSGQTTIPVSAPQHAPEHTQAPPVNPREQAAVQPNNNINVADGIEEEEEGRGNRDWLDWFYTMSRVMVLFSIVYFYSSPARFIIVSALGLTLYLYQLGFFRAQQLQAARIVAENNNEAVDERGVVENNNLQNQNEGMGARAEVQGQQRLPREEGSGAEEPDPEPDRPSVFAITWTIFTSFFASLIPEQPGAL
ncbi:Homocysteine-responsive endoplasmic reticulum-resident ubiquitin-like domain member 2 protein [Cryptotermes secundus]|uniref:Homocysteine-responsive endoplasmic reticulum-resident ubiquitin-like domain member 2 protein n=1 Tax=Cryptotermes secundus TaxID=105785 RepID=A0A2J7PZQ2_9NEOP|nr:homocysteine-responsive endoplasmic reticulum-resident ubiquitin-like domain member 2 protein [Cryptotermes secundus]XP_023719086.1 homocysteine-responsive endoplasmic reticulum-resident ubiquitin-like domain member 2 protein [Cryptotermes secundus]PNF21816.1 Homocysteine-responsive endoplasmic reticulum-resident ubiquitin-like domain member 2 protein [Cryptotermes secundus]PNF21817.1 Homocysteine-responsive endoplasmic reticulum-resident ubiquitin-like domain member 2 protein [Cryptotermes s